MMIQKNRKEPKKIYYTIGEVADMFNVNASLIRYWEKEFNIIKPQKNKKGNRLFRQEDINNFYVIYHLVKERGFTLQGAKEKIQKNKEETIGDIEVIKTLKNIKEFLLDIKKEL